MVLGPLELLLLAGFPLLLGAAVLRLFGLVFRSDPVGYLGWCFTCGALVLAALELVRLVTGLGSPGPLVVLGLLLSGVAYARGRRRAPVPPSPRAEGRAGRIVFGVVLALALAVTAVRAVEAGWTAIVREDEVIFWSKRAKLWFVAEGFGGVYALGLKSGQLPNADYPFLNPLLQLWCFDLAGRITHVVNRVPLQLACLALVLSTAAALRRAAGPWLAAALLILLVTSSPAAFAVRRAGSDVLVALGSVVALDAWLRARGEHLRAWQGLAGLAVAFLLWSKNEGLLFVAAFVVAQAWLLRARPRAFLAVARAPSVWLPGACVLALTLLHNAWFDTRGNHAPWIGGVQGFVDAFGRDLANTLKAFGKGFVSPSVHQVPAAFLLLVALAPAARRGQAWPLVLSFLMLLVGLLVVFVAKTVDPARALGNSVSRLELQLFPAALLGIALVVSQLVAEARGAAAGDPARVTRPQ